MTSVHRKWGGGMTDSWKSELLYIASFYTKEGHENTDSLKSPTLRLVPSMDRCFPSLVFTKEVQTSCKTGKRNLSGLSWLEGVCSMIDLIYYRRPPEFEFPVLSLTCFLCRWSFLSVVWLVIYSTMVLTIYSLNFIRTVVIWVPLLPSIIVLFYTFSSVIFLVSPLYHFL